MKNILCYGDSNTYGAIAGSDQRFGRYERWPGKLQEILGPDYYVIEEGCNGRTTVWDDPIEEGKNGKTYLEPCLTSHKPLDLVILMLGTNDLKNRFSVSPLDVTWSLRNLIGKIKNGSYGHSHNEHKCKVLLLSPPAITEMTDLEGIFHGAEAKQKALAPLLARLAKEQEIDFLDTAPLAEIDPVDGLHLSLAGHAALAAALADKVREII